MGRLVIKRSTGSIHIGKGLFNRSKNKPSKSIGIQDDMFDLKVGKGISDAHLTLYYSPGRLLDEQSTESRSRSNSTEDDEDITSDNTDDDDKSMDQSVDDVSDGKRKVSSTFVDSIINGTGEDSSMIQPAKIRCFDTSISDCRESSEQKKDMNTGHSLSKIPPTERKKWPQKPCVHCRRKYGFRNDTRFICILCNAALCKKPCFSEYHCTK